jgi:cytochrome c-type biogenesis protein CcmH/NrfG
VDLLRRDPYHPGALLALGETLLDLDQHDDASVAFDRILRSDPNHVGALYYQGAVLASRHRYREAIACWQQVVVAAPDSPYADLARRDARTATDLRMIFRTPAEATHAD